MKKSRFWGFACLPQFASRLPAVNFTQVASYCRRTCTSLPLSSAAGDITCNSPQSGSPSLSGGENMVGWGEKEGKEGIGCFFPLLPDWHSILCAGGKFRACDAATRIHPLHARDVGEYRLQSFCEYHQLIASLTHPKDIVCANSKLSEGWSWAMNTELVTTWEEALDPPSPTLVKAENLKK